MTAERPIRIAFDHVRLDVADIARAEAFYVGLLGLDHVVRYRTATTTIVQLGVGGRPAGVELWREDGLVPRPHATGHIAFSVADVAALVERARGRGHPVLTEPFAIGAETVAFLGDPDGHRVELNDFRGRGVGEAGGP